MRQAKFKLKKPREEKIWDCIRYAPETDGAFSVSGDAKIDARIELHKWLNSSERDGHDKYGLWLVAQVADFVLIGRASSLSGNWFHVIREGDWVSLSGRTGLSIHQDRDVKNLFAEVGEDK